MQKAENFLIPQKRVFSISNDPMLGRETPDNVGVRSYSSSVEGSMSYKCGVSCGGDFLGLRISLCVCMNAMNFHVTL